MLNHRLTKFSLFSQSSWHVLGGLCLGLSMAVTLPAVSGCATTRSASAQYDDSVIANRVGRALTSDDVVRRAEIDVDSLNGLVTLRGEVESDEARTRAAEVARQSEGVLGVDNQLTVESEPPDRPADGVITARVKARLAADPEVKAVNVDVDTEEGVVTLSGIVETEVARSEALQLARLTDGVRDVVDELQVSSS